MILSALFKYVYNNLILLFKFFPVNNFNLEIFSYSSARFLYQIDFVLLVIGKKLNGKLSL